MRKRDKGKYFSSFTEPACQRIDLPFNIDSLRHVLKQAAFEQNVYTHQQISNWAWGFWWECDEGVLMEAAEDDAQLSAAAEIALDIDSQWDMFLFNTYSMEQLQSIDISKVQLPREWFQNWLEKIGSQTTQ